MTKTLLIAIALFAGCDKTNPNYCAGAPDNNCNELRDASSDATNCAACATGTCAPGTNTCAVCTTAESSACTSTTPVCGSDDTCHACTADSQCASAACMPDGSCADPATVLYASATGGPAATCMAADMCTIDHALVVADSTHKIIKLDPGMYGTSGLSVTKTVTLVGRSATVDKNSGANGPVFAVATPSTTVELDYLTIQGGDDSSLGNGVTCASATLILRSVDVQTNAAMGISGQSCNVTIDRGLIYNNIEGGVYLTGSAIQFDITNTFVIRNGNTNDGTFGGVNINTTVVGTSRFEFNTVADNLSSTGITHFGGVTCDISGFTAGDNIVAQNSKAGVATSQQTEGACTFQASLVQDDESGLAFVNATSAPYSYEILSTSTAKDQATFPSLVDVDNKGEFRPQGVQKDIGADEYKP